MNPKSRNQLEGGPSAPLTFQRGLLCEQCLKPEGQTVVHCSEVFIGINVSKDRHAVAIAESGPDGEVRFFGEFGSDMASARRFLRKVEQPDRRLRFCYEAGPTGYGLQRLIEGLGHECAVNLHTGQRASECPHRQAG